MNNSTNEFVMSTSPHFDREERETTRPTNHAKLYGQVRRIAALADDERERMHTLLAYYFSGTTRAHFERDLDEKEWAILLFNEKEQLRGFSTLMRLHACVGEQRIVAFFSGDTIIDRAHWGQITLPQIWARHVFDLAAEIHDTPVYWFLISSGYKTYRLLPRFFHTFYPTYTRPTPPAMQQVIDALALLKFPSEYDRERGVVRLTQATPLRDTVAPIDAARLNDPHIAFFAQTNPGHLYGDELACLTELTRDNLTPEGQHMLVIPDTGVL
jgi:hypothetical protein